MYSLKRGIVKNRENISWVFDWWQKVETEYEMIGFDEKVLIAEFRNILIQGRIGHRKVAINMHWWGKVMIFTLLFINIIINYVKLTQPVTLTLHAPMKIK